MHALLLYWSLPSLLWESWMYTLDVRSIKSDTAEIETRCYVRYLPSFGLDV